MLGALLAPKFLVLYTFIASATYIHQRGRVKLPFFRQLTDHSTFIAPINCFMYAFSAVPNRPILDLADFPDLKPLQDNWQIIREEALALYLETLDELGKPVPEEKDIRQPVSLGVTVRVPIIA